MGSPTKGQHPTDRWETEAPWRSGEAARPSWWVPLPADFQPCLVSCLSGRRLCALGGSCWGKSQRYHFGELTPSGRTRSSRPFGAGWNQGRLSHHELGPGVILALRCSVSEMHLGLSKRQCSCLRNGENSQGRRELCQLLNVVSQLIPPLQRPWPPWAAPQISTGPPPRLGRAAIASVILWGRQARLGIQWPSGEQWCLCPREAQLNTLPSFHTWPRCLDSASVSPCSRARLHPTPARQIPSLLRLC